MTFQGTQKDAKGDPLWSGASATEKDLVDCCELPSNDGEEHLVGGALAKEKVVPFVGILASQCHDLVTRALALAILEQAFDADEADRLDDEMDESQHSSASSSEATAGVDTRKRSQTERQQSDKPGDKSKEPDRLTAFLAAGGLRILNQWLVEATTPVPVPAPKSPPTTSGRQQKTPPLSTPETKSSPTSPLLLPLLELLKNLPVNRQWVTQSKINKNIRKLYKIVQSVTPRAVNYSTHPVTGQVPAIDIQKSLDELKSNWEERSKNAPPNQFADPFAGVKSSIQVRLKELKNYESGETEKPEWLAKGENAQKARPQKKLKIESTKQLARRERENEKAAIMKDDLKKFAEERANLLKKLRELKRKQSEEAMEREQQSQNRRRVQWKDGLSAASKLRKRELLEEVFVINTNDPNEESDGEDDDLFAQGTEDTASTESKISEDAPPI